MPEIWMDVDTALSEVPVNIMPLIDDTDFKTRETGIAYNQAGMDLVWNFVTTGGVHTQTAVTPTTGGDYDWVNQGDAMYTIEIPASGGASINNDTEGFGWFSGICTGVLPWRGPVIGFRASGLNALLIDNAYSATRGLSGTALPAAAADAAGGLPISDNGGLDLDTQLANTNEITTARMGALTDWIDGGRLDLILDDILGDTATTLPANQTLIYDRIGVPAGADIAADIADIPTVAEFEARTLVSSNYFDPAIDTVVNITNCANNADMRGTDNAALASVCTEARLAELGATNIPSDIDALNTKIGTNVDVAGTTTVFARLRQVVDSYLADGTIGLAQIESLVDDLETRLTSARAGYLDNLNGHTAQSGDSFPRIGVNGSGLTSLPWNAAWDAEVQSEVQDAIEANHLDHLLAVDYDPASKPGVPTALLNEMVESDGGVSRFTANALEEAPSGTGGDATEANQTTIITHLTELKGSGFIESTDSNEAIRDRGDVAWGGSAASFVGLQGGLLLNFRINEKTGNYIYDNLHSFYEGIIDGGVTFSRGIKSYALNFDGTDDIKCYRNFGGEKYVNNPIASAGPDEAEYYKRGIYDPSLLWVGDEVYMYCSEVGSDEHIRESLWISQDDGLTFEYYGVVLDVGAEGEWDDWKAHDVDVVLDPSDGLYKMLYNGNKLPADWGKIGLATSPDGKVWTKHPANPVFDVDVPGSWDDTGVNYPTVHREGTTFYMFYGGYNSVPQYGGMGLATSTDLVTWTREPSNPVLPSAFHHKYTVTPYNNKYYVICQSDANYNKLLMGYSTDKLNWTMFFHPVIRASGSGWDSNVVEDADLYFDSDGTGHIYYSGATIKGHDNQIGIYSVPNLANIVEEGEILNAYPISVAFWIKTVDSGSGCGVINKGNDSSPYNAYNIYLSGGRLKAFYSLDSSNYVSMVATGNDGGIINDGLWHHVIFTVDASGGEIFVDLASINSVSWTGTPGAISDTEALEIGGYTDYLDGEIDDIRIYDHALSSDERRGIVIGIPYLEDNTLETVLDQEKTHDEISELQGEKFISAQHSNYAIVQTGNANWGKLAGSNSITINIKDQGANNVVGCNVEIWDSGNTTYYERQATNSSGNVSYNIDDGTYTVRIHKAGYVFSAQTLVVDGDATENYTGTTIIIGTPADPDACRVYDYALQGDDETPVSTLTACCFIVSLPYDYNGSLHSGERREPDFDTDTGLFFWDIVKGATVKFHIKHFGYTNKQKVIPDEDQARLSEI